jgi:methionine synthase II (cobalamin-independent)
MDQEVPPIRSTGIGSWPGTDMADAIKIAFAECPDLPYLPELPARGPYAELIGRGTAFLAGLAVDLQTAGWRLTDASSRDHRLAISTLRSDLDLLEELAQGYAGPVKIAVAGPWTMAAHVERPRGDRALADSGARRDLGQSLAEGVGSMIAELRRRLPEIEFTVQLDEPSLPAVLAGSLTTASSLSRHPAVDRAEVRGSLLDVMAQIRAAGSAAVVVHCCAPAAPIPLLQEAGADGVYLDLDSVAASAWDAVASCLVDGVQIGLGALPTDRLALTGDQVAGRVLNHLRKLGLDPPIAARVVITPSCGLATAERELAVGALRTIRTAAAIVSEQIAE